MLRVEARNSQVPIEKKPEWIKTRLRTGPEYTELKNAGPPRGPAHGLRGGGCPNIFECWEDREATFLIGGDQCTRRCDFCQIDTGKPRRSTATSRAGWPSRSGHGPAVRDHHRGRPRRPAGRRGLAVRADRAGDPRAVPGLRRRAADPGLLRRRRTGSAEVFAHGPRSSPHNVETVPRIFRRIRPGFRYERSLDVMTQARAAGLVTKSNLILGMGEERAEVSQALADLHDAGCDLVTITQYLRPSPRHHPVERWVKPEEFVELGAEARGLGFAGVMSGPLVRSSYRAGRLYRRRGSARRHGRAR